jgi:hypothetical protein
VLIVSCATTELVRTSMYPRFPFEMEPMLRDDPMIQLTLRCVVLEFYPNLRWRQTDNIFSGKRCSSSCMGSLGLPEGQNPLSAEQTRPSSFFRPVRRGSRRSRSSRRPLARWGAQGTAESGSTSRRGRHGALGKSSRRPSRDRTTPWPNDPNVCAPNGCAPYRLPLPNANN